ncbi:MULTISPECIES: endonuclease/exonuclease/phosphatase family protein [Streptomyces]|uniref:endonuclease/exonuclease/phosphatase family protein n=1 Tax=Streptomyces TaxID=1883 RepID=UPI00163BB4B1|nr:MULTISPECIES: endonuclease/exonuclease/phosphatase family protein [Streptomyces]MBC2877223.1 endonuclease/exonuclease/phosphatase family protein [Streptomyces sp. TYQ1024]UBI39489.1 endonuclease/exonuclease/phosphatase family protein [Streptomyces mobaraensis]UKW32068.1 endonuclease/exonuclease/phosphatase family protein [Streptomyces sp. TYQ1024]
MPSSRHRSTSHTRRSGRTGRVSRAYVTTGTLVTAALAAGLLTAPTAGAAGATGGSGGTRIHDIQGTTRVSPLAGKQVTEVPGVVTAVRAFGSARGFWFQDPHPDRDAATSEAVFVFTGATTPSVAVGDAVLVSATVGEYYPGGEAAGLQSVTQLTKATWTVTSSGNALPAAVELNARTLPARYAPALRDGGDGSIEKLRLEPGRYALDRFESLEGMRVAVKDAPVTGATSSHKDLWVTADPRHHRTARGGVLYSSYADPNAARVKVSSLIPFAQRPFPVANVGDELTGTTAGPLDYDNYGGYTLQATELGTLADHGLKRETTRRQRDGELAVATYNVENLAPQNPQEKFDRLASALVTNLASPDIVALEEVQDDSGVKNDGTVDASVTLRKLTDAVAKAGGPRYEWRQIDPVDGKDGGQPGGNIRTAFLFNPARVSFTDIAGGGSTNPVDVVRDHGRAALTASPGRVDPANAAWENSRKPLAGQFTFRGERVLVIANHFNSKGGDQGVDSRFQPPARTSEVQRGKQAAVVNAFVKRILAADRKANVIVAGDLNDYQFSPALRTLTSGKVLTDQVGLLPAKERYGYVYQGNSQVLDHILTSPAMSGKGSRSGRTDYDIVHINAEFADQASDHDPQVLRWKPRG